MGTCRSHLGAYLWDQRSNRGIKRSKLAKLIDCDRRSIVLLEDRGQDDENILPKIIDLFELDLKTVEELKAEDKQYQLEWIERCGRKDDPIIIAARKPMTCPVPIPSYIVDAGYESVEEFAKSFARDWNRTIELFVRNHIRFVISPTGEFVINELGFYEPWLDAKEEP